MTTRIQCERCLQPLEVGIDSQIIEYYPSTDLDGSAEQLVLWRCPRCLEEFVE